MHGGTLVGSTDAPTLRKLEESKGHGGIRTHNGEGQVILSQRI